MKKLLSSFFTFILCAGLFSMPVFESYIPDTSGEFVYYQDKSFERTSYVGILYYDDETFQVRYYAPKDEAKFLPEKDISLLLSVNPEANHWDMTGERILTSISPDPASDDAQIVNYLHDLLYEFSSRRGHRPVINFQNQQEESFFSEFVQFGGNVKVVYDCIIPLFNIRSIEDTNGEKVLDCVTIGQIKDTNDPTFDEFKGFNSLENSEEKTVKSYKKAKSVNVSFENQHLSLDKNWKQQLENFWTLNEDSLIALSSIPTFYDDADKNNCFIIRKLLLSAKDSYTVFSDTEYFINADKIKIVSKTAQTNTNRIIYNTKLLNKNEQNKSLDYFSIATYESAYKNNQGYFEKIIKSYKN